jgi:hypothetical protein
MFVLAGCGTRFSCVCYLATLLCLDYVALNDRILGELERNSKGEVVVQPTKVLHGDSSGAIEKNHEIFNIAGVLARIQTECLQNTSLVDSSVIQLYHNHYAD